ncbi:ATP:cob(I)alamin adenosyltransferase [Treponema primitia ZAS-2]|uniref:Corrinoid adenosyltransferase n=1 Tax=Treponema primitia (strain ATCC BAA-887 / DSM 12427 / ZAS-2) TaxID=545694 RepID=F5YQS1_TREPZ|nr:cob(I)yrinic acid a,c-diamide adenosyltransferase [Treponema primitia]AEF86491.1 ATP:cob(I)alamin adenosyltransferase [Treponema primitia ZAS-2]
MSISTGLGDDGSTELLAGTWVPKDHPRVEFIGTLDELNSFLGDAKAAALLERTKTIIDSVQRDLFVLATALDVPDGAGASAGKEASILPGGGAVEPERLTAWLHEIEEKHPMRGFIIPGANPVSAKLDIARTVCRRAERRLVTVARQETVSPKVLRYMNRLSDLLFILARSEEGDGEA